MIFKEEFSSTLAQKPTIFSVGSSPFFSPIKLSTFKCIKMPSRVAPHLRGLADPIDLDGMSTCHVVERGSPSLGESSWRLVVKTTPVQRVFFIWRRWCMISGKFAIGMESWQALNIQEKCSSWLNFYPLGIIFTLLQHKLPVVLYLEIRKSKETQYTTWPW